MRFVPVLLISLALTGCNVVAVHEAPTGKAQDAKKIKGIPFYVKTEQFTKTTVYSQTWLRATLKVDIKVIDLKDGKETTVSSSAVPLVAEINKTEKATLEEIKAKIIAADRTGGGSPNEIMDTFRTLQSKFDPSKVTADLVSNSVTSKWVVDRTNVYYLNAKQPWFGSAALTQKLAADGTLSESSSTIDTKLAEGLSNLIPFKEYLTGKFVKTPAAAKADATTEAKKVELADAFRRMKETTGEKPPAANERDRRVVYDVSLLVEEVGIQSTLTTLPASTPITSLVAIPFEDAASGKVLVTRTAIGKTAKGDEKDDENSISISGSIRLPKAPGKEGADSSE